MNPQISITPIAALKDNYIWIISNNSHALVIDPGEAEPVLKFLKSNRLSLSAILITHHHKDHVGGVETLINHFNSEIYAPVATKFNCLKRNVKEGSHISLEGLPTLSVLEIPGHTLDHIAFYYHNHLFCGDTLFSAGCGRVFEGSYEQMYRSLLKIKSLPPATNIYCAHEYTQQNLYFAKAVDPDNNMIEEKISYVSSLLEQRKPSLPSTLQDELQINPFLRCNIPVIARAAEIYMGQSLKNEVEVFKVLREWKNIFVWK